MPVQVNIFILLFGAIQGIFLSLLLFQKKVYRNGYLFLLLYLLLMVLQATLKVMSKMWLLDNMQLLYSLSYQFPLLYGPLIFLFTKNFAERKSVKVYDYLHFVPFTAVLCCLLFGNYYEEPPVVISSLFHPAGRLVVELASIVFYHSLSYYNYKKQQNSLKDKCQGITNRQTKWIQQFVIVSFIVCSFIAVVIYLMYTWFPFSQDIRFGFILLTIFIYWISYSAWHDPLLFAPVTDRTGKAVTLNAAPGLIIHKPQKKYAHSGLDTDQINKILLLLEQAMEKEKLFLDPEITIEKIAEHIQYSRHHLSQVLNEGLHRSFYDFMNYYRVEEAKHLLADPKRAEHKIASIAYDAGFNSLSTFNDIFKKNTGITPSQYRKTPMQKSLGQRV